MSRLKIWMTTALLTGLICGITGCSSDVSSISFAKEAGDVNVNTSYYYLPVGSYDSADTAILKSIDADMGTVTLYNTVADKSYTLIYDGTTYVSDKYGTAMSMAQLKEGMIVNVNFLKSTKQLVDIQISPEAWSYEKVTRYDLGGMNSTASVGDRTYSLTKGVQVFSDGQQADLMNIVDGDAITVSGIGYDIYSITVESGHGYIRLSNDEALVGGWVEVGSELISKVTEEGMLLTVPEGTYTVRMYNDTSSVVQDVIVDRNQEVILDCQGITAPVDTYGRILFNITPDTATLKLDGEYQNKDGVIRTEYGIHQIEVSAPGYDSMSRYINVGTDLAEISINLDESVAYVSGNSSYDDINNLNKNSEDTTNNSEKTNDPNSISGNKSVSSNTTSGNTTGTTTKKETTTKKGNRVYITYPEFAEIYVDGIYQGLSPMSFKKVAGAHTIILKRDGFVTKSYTIYLYDDGDDISISFSNLEQVGANSNEGGVTNNNDSNNSYTDNTNTGNTNSSGNVNDSGSTNNSGDTNSGDNGSTNTTEGDTNVNGNVDSGGQSDNSGSSDNKESVDMNVTGNSGSNENEEDTDSNTSDEGQNEGQNEEDSGIHNS